MSLLKLHENPNLTCESLTFIDKDNIPGNDGITKKFTKKLGMLLMNHFVLLFSSLL